MEALRNIAKRAKEYPLAENKKTLPFRFIKLRHIVTIFILAYFGWVIFSTWLYYNFIDPSIFNFWKNGAEIEYKNILNL